MAIVKILNLYIILLCTQLYISLTLWQINCPPLTDPTLKICIVFLFWYISFGKIVSFYIHLGYSLYDIVLFGLTPYCRGIVGKNQSTRSKTTVRSKVFYPLRPGGENPYIGSPWQLKHFIVKKLIPATALAATLQLQNDEYH